MKNKPDHQDKRDKLESIGFTILFLILVVITKPIRTWKKLRGEQ